MDSNNNPTGADPLQDLAKELNNYTPEPEPATAASAPATPAAPAAAPVMPTAPVADSAPAFSPSADLTATATVSASPNGADTTANPFDQAAAEPAVDSAATDPNDFTAQPVAAAESTEPTEPVDRTPLKPADPVPGSIGSAKSYQPPVADPLTQPQPAPAAAPAAPVAPVTPTTPTAPAQPAFNPAQFAPVDPQTANPQAATLQPADPAAPKKKLSKTTIILLAVLAVIALVGGIFAILFATGVIGGTKTSVQQTTYTAITPAANEPVKTGLLCTITYTADEAALAADPTLLKYDDKVVINYADDEATDFNFSRVAVYNSAESASAAVQAHGDATSALVAGLEGSNLGTPSMSAVATDASVTTSTVFDAEYLSQLNAAKAADPANTAISAIALDLPTDEAGLYLSTSDKVHTYFTNKGYTCTTTYAAADE